MTRPGQTAAEADQDQDHQHEKRRQSKMYLRFGAMILSATVVMYAVMYVNTYEWGHVQWNESRMFMAFTMGGTMALVMLGWMLNMFRNARVNVAIVAVSVLLLAGVIDLDRSQTTIQDDSFMSAMIPHHSIAILSGGTRRDR